MSQKSGDSPDKIANFHSQEHTSRLQYGFPLLSISLMMMYHVFYTDIIATTFPATVTTHISQK
jgi:hypothetical protein